MKAVIAAYARSPQQFARKGPFALLRPDTLAAQVVTGLLARTDFDPALIEDVILGCAYPEGPQGTNLARIVAFLSNLPQEVGGMTVNRFCGSSMSVIHIAASQIEAGVGEAYLCVGVESMSMVPQGGFNKSPNPELLERLPDAYISMGQTAENVAKRYNVSRHDQEVLAVESHRKAAQAREQGRLRDEIVPIRLESGELIDSDGCIRPGTTLEALAALKPAFGADGDRRGFRGLGHER
jgi:acetyl-CoA acyltransferase